MKIFLKIAFLSMMLFVNHTFAMAEEEDTYLGIEMALVAKRNDREFCNYRKWSTKASERKIAELEQKLKAFTKEQRPTLKEILEELVKRIAAFETAKKYMESWLGKRCDEEVWSVKRVKVIESQIARLQELWLEVCQEAKQE